MAKTSAAKTKKTVTPVVEKKEVKAASVKASAPKAKVMAPEVKPVAAPAAAKVAPAPKATPVVAQASKAAPAAKAPAKKEVAKTISAQDRYHMIDEAAYYRAEKAGFQVDPHANWIAAEAEIDELLSKQNIKLA